MPTRQLAIGIETDRGPWVAAPVHPSQVLDESLPHHEHDFTVNYIITPQQIIPCDAPYRPTGLVWDALNRDKIAAIPVLAAMAHER
jgi:5-formyltetrahydrofolate cyclo-ligase